MSGGRDDDLVCGKKKKKPDLDRAINKTDDLIGSV
jgi:hypothetical protein